MTVIAAERLLGARHRAKTAVLASFGPPSHPEKGPFSPFRG